MKKFLILLLFLTFSLVLNAQIKNVETPYFSVQYSETLEQPLKVTYVVFCYDGKFKRDGLDFYTNDSIHTSDNDDYINNIWDKGHMAPAADFNCNLTALKSSFSYLNCALQHQDLNRQTWRYLEAKERELARYSKIVYVEIEVIFNDSCEQLPTGATVPYAFKKTIYVDDAMWGAYIFKNEKPVSTNYEYYRVQ